MKKIMFVMRAGFDADYIIANLSGLLNQYNVTYVIESGTIARKKNLIE